MIKYDYWGGSNPPPDNLKTTKQLAELGLKGVKTVAFIETRKYTISLYDINCPQKIKKCPFSRAFKQITYLISIMNIIARTPKIFTSNYSGLQIGKSISISLYPPKGCKFDHLPLFAPSEQLLKFWKTSKKDKSAQDKYITTFKEEMDAKRHLIDLWIKKIDSEYITLNCYENPDEFCHRHILKDYLPADMWEGEIAGSRNISARDASWSQIFDNQWKIIFDNRPVEDKPVIEPVTTETKTRQRKAA